MENLFTADPNVIQVPWGEWGCSTLLEKPTTSEEDSLATFSQETEAAQEGFSL